ncbi:MAG TPA: hypothetical protein VNY04_02530 [Chthoniobacterales bacterium]|nr:hypothetical protein [Chthoniobacterales bacterium]
MSIRRAAISASLLHATLVAATGGYLDAFTFEEERIHSCSAWIKSHFLPSRFLSGSRLTPNPDPIG